MMIGRITKEEKLKICDKMISYVKSKIAYYEKNDEYETDYDEVENVMYNACKTAGFMFYEFLIEKLEDEEK